MGTKLDLKSIYITYPHDHHNSRTIGLVLTKKNSEAGKIEFSWKAVGVTAREIFAFNKDDAPVVQPSGRLVFSSDTYGVIKIGTKDIGTLVRKKPTDRFGTGNMTNTGIGQFSFDWKLD